MSGRVEWVVGGLERANVRYPDHPGFAVDLFVQEPFDFEAVYQRALQVPLQGTQAIVVSREDLMAMKRAAGRARDLEDIEALSVLPEEGS